jgi:hypothetical protein
MCADEILFMTGADDSIAAMEQLSVNYRSAR